MEAKDFNSFQQDIQSHYQSGDYAASLSLVIEHGDDYPEYQHLLSYWRITLLTRIGEMDQALDYLREILLTGFWYGEALLRKNPALSALQGMETFEELVALNQALHQRDSEHVYPMLTLRSAGKCEAGGEPCPLVIGLHANACMAADSLPFWQPAAHAGWMVAAPQSSQAMWKGAYMWDDRQAAENQINELFISLTQSYAIDPDNIILAGHSMGGDIAIWLALTQDFPIRGFIAIGPDGPFLESMEEWAPQFASRGLNNARGYIIIGAEDATIAPENIRKLTEVLNQNGFDCQLDSIPGAGRDYSPDYGEALLRGLAYLVD
jgi:predicted esterase